MSSFQSVLFFWSARFPRNWRSVTRGPDIFHLICTVL